MMRVPSSEDRKIYEEIESFAYYFDATIAKLQFKGNTHETLLESDALKAAAIAVALFSAIAYTNRFITQSKPYQVLASVGYIALAVFALLNRHTTSAYSQHCKEVDDLINPIIKGLLIGAYVKLQAIDKFSKEFKQKTLDFQTSLNNFIIKFNKFPEVQNDSIPLTSPDTWKSYHDTLRSAGTRLILGTTALQKIKEILDSHLNSLSPHASKRIIDLYNTTDLFFYGYERSASERAQESTDLLYVQVSDEKNTIKAWPSLAKHSGASGWFSSNKNYLICNGEHIQLVSPKDLE